MTNDEDLQRTPLNQAHKDLGAKMVPFAGWEMPVQYAGVIAEHVATRTQAALFDVSHMGEIEVRGPNALAALQYLTCNDVSKIEPGKGQYNAITNERGGIVDDIIVYKYNDERYFVCVNASNAQKDFEWFCAHNKFGAEIVNRSSEFGQIAVQGPKAVDVMRALPGAAAACDLAYFGFADLTICDVPCIVARTGYTGEDGFEIFTPAEKTAAIWFALLETKLAMPCGLGARDSLRLEACYPLHGHELGEDISAIESGLGWIVKPEKGEFIGKDVIAAHKANGAPRSLVGFIVDDAGIARQGDKILAADGAVIGEVTSGTKTPTINKALGLGIVKSDFAKTETKFFVEVRGRKLAAHVVKRPFYRKPAGQ